MRAPAIDQRLGLGVGLDLPWHPELGFATGKDGRDRVSDQVTAFFDRHGADYAYAFTSWQPRDRNRLHIDHYAEAFDDLFARVVTQPVRALHHTALNLASTDPSYQPQRERMIQFTNALIRRYDLAWVNEDLGIWSLAGRPLPYPLPPLFTDEGLRAAVANTALVQERLEAPLVVEFPGFSHGCSVVVGDWHAYDFFAEVVRETGSPATLDTGHLLSYQVQKGARGEELYRDLERLPLENTFEIHLSGCALERLDGPRDRFLDYHHGILIDEQLELLRRLVPLCPRLRAITYEDPRFDDTGALPPAAHRNLDRLSAFADDWRRP